MKRHSRAPPILQSGLKGSVEIFRRLYETTPAMLHSIDSQGRLLGVSDIWLAKLGYSREEVIGRPSVSFLTPASCERAVTQVLPLFFKQGRCDDVEYQMVTRSGQVIDVLMSAILERDASGQPLCSTAVIQDVTQRHRAERALSEERQRLADGRSTSAATVMQAGDTTCFAAKEAGRNRVHVWRDTDTGIRKRHGEMQWAMRIEHALDENRFVLHAQRIERLADGPSPLRAEVLLRMVDEDSALVLPGAFLPAAERFHLASRIDRWVLQAALHWLKALPASSFGYLKSLTVDYLKIDGQFIRHLLDDALDQAAVRCFVEVARVMDLRTVAEFVDQPRILAKVREMGIDYAQGFLVHRPAPIDQLWEK